jgi:hypothetical protein
MNQKQFETMCTLQCPIEEICEYFTCTVDDLDLWCLASYGLNLTKMHLKGKSKGRIQIRSIQRNLARRNATLAVWLGRQYLGQTNIAELEKPIGLKNDGLWDAIAESVRNVNYKSQESEENYQSGESTFSL